MSDDTQGIDPFSIAVARILAKKDGADFDSARNFGDPEPDPTKYTVSKHQYIKDARCIVEGFYAIQEEGLDVDELVAVWNNTLPLVAAWEKEIADGLAKQE